MCSYLIPPLLDGLAGVRKLALGLLFPNAGAGGGLVTLEREPLKYTKTYKQCWATNVLFKYNLNKFGKVKSHLPLQPDLLS